MTTAGHQGCLDNFAHTTIPSLNLFYIFGTGIFLAVDLLGMVGVKTDDVLGTKGKKLCFLEESHMFEVFFVMDGFEVYYDFKRISDE